jgi:hypothetical protein
MRPGGAGHEGLAAELRPVKVAGEWLKVKAEP